MRNTVATIVTLVLMLIFIFLLGGSITYTRELIEADGKVFQKRLNQKVVVNKDTLVIIDYSIFNKTYTLSNSLVVDTGLVTNIIVK